MVGRTIDEQFPALKEAHPEVLARHWTEAGESELAIAAWTKAGQRAVERRAYREGVSAGAKCQLNADVKSQLKADARCPSQPATALVSEQTITNARR